MELSLDLPKRRSGENVSVGRSAPQVVPHSLTHSLTHIHSLISNVLDFGAGCLLRERAFSVCPDEVVHFKPDLSRGCPM